TDTDSLISEFSQGKSMNDLQLIARLASLMVAALKAPLPDGSQLATFAAVLGDATESAAEAQAEGANPAAGVAGAQPASGGSSESGGFDTSSPAVSDGERRGGDVEASSFQPALHGTA
ncbi:MAG: TetR/AcrR family transcriptional regulator, partial [Paraburkholderia fungorum]